jgi:hypothetical protein
MNKTKLPSLIPILILTLLTAVMWVTFEVFRAIKTLPESSVPASISQPLTPTLDKDSINKIESRIFLNDSQIPNVIATPSSAPKTLPTATPKSTATPSATIQPVASSSATPTP